MKRKIMALCLAVCISAGNAFSVPAETVSVTPMINGGEAPKKIISMKAGSNTYTVNGTTKSYDKSLGEMYIDESGRCMLPLRATPQVIGENGVLAEWDDAAKTAYLYYEDSSVKEDIAVTVGKDTMTVRGEEIKLNTPAVIRNGRVYLPMRSILNAFHVSDDKITWEDASKTVSIDRTLSLDTDKITVIVSDGTSEKRNYTEITDRNKIAEIQALLAKDGFSEMENGNQYTCTIFIDFNNGTTIGLNRYYSYGYIANGIKKMGSTHLPDALNGYMMNLLSNYTVRMPQSTYDAGVTKLALTIQNKGSINVEYGEEYQIEKLSGGQWQELPAADTNDVAIFVRPNESATFTANLAVPLESGKYRLRKAFNNIVQYFEFTVK